MTTHLNEFFRTLFVKSLHFLYFLHFCKLFLTSCMRGTNVSPAFIACFHVLSVFSSARTATTFLRHILNFLSLTFFAITTLLFSSSITSKTSCFTFGTVQNSLFTIEVRVQKFILNFMMSQRLLSFQRCCYA